MGFFGGGDPELNRLGKQIKHVGGKIRGIERELRRHEDAQLSYHRSFVGQAPQSIVKSLLLFIDSMPTQFPQHLSLLSSAHARSLRDELRAFCTSAPFRIGIEDLMALNENWEHTGGNEWSVKRGHGLLVARETSVAREPFYFELRVLMRPIETICSRYSVGLGHSIRESPAFGALPLDLKHIAKDYIEMCSKVTAIKSQLREAQADLHMQEREYEIRKVWKQS